jgi:uncharacterized membrane protein YraQ (UPF0718 family)
VNLLTDFFRSLLRQRLLWVVASLYLWAWLISPSRALIALHAGLSLLLSVTILILAVFALVGLIQTWVGREIIGRVLGREGGFKGLLISLACGTILIGPPYVIFPLLMSLRRLGARWAVITIVLAAYALKPQMLPLEAQFLGFPFALVRGGLTLLMAIPLGLAVERLMPPDKQFSPD